jgi:outer membrane lipoprotein-sorting protein
MTKKLLIAFCLALFIIAGLCGSGKAEDAQALVQASFDYYRGKASTATVDMTIHRPDWERVVTIRAWTKGQEESLFWITAPPKDEGNSTLKKGREMWIYNPKVNRVIKLPPSMMSQSWMGSDFSNNDLAKSDSLIKDYSHSLTGTETHEGKKVYLIQSIPKLEAPVVWGMQKLKIREDHIFLSQAFFDEDLKLVKIMTAHDIQMLGGKLFPRAWRMQKAEAWDEYTELTYNELDFKEDLPENLFTLTNLKNPRR